MVQLEDLIQDAGGCGRYQLILALIVHSMKCVVCFSMLFMVYGAVTPDWWCADDTRGLDNSTFNGVTFKACSLANWTSACTHFKFEDTAKTIVTKWNLVCDNDWVPSTITSLQMAGVLVGSIVCGHLADLIGRKRPLFLSLLILIISNFIATFSTSWVMYAVMRFFIGLGIGFELTVQYTIMCEFTLARWRTWIIAVPSWAIEICLFALVSWLVNDWRRLHFATAAIGVPFLAAYWFVPESFRWYVGHDRIKDAENVIKRVAKVNGKPPPDMSNISQIDMSQVKDRKYSLFDILKNKDLRNYTLLFAINWITLGLVGYGIQFGVTALSGNIYINMFVIGLISSPAQLILIPLQNRFGRKKTAILTYVLCAVTAFIVAITRYFPETNVRNQLSNAAAIMSLTSISVSWYPVQTLTIEIYPTVVRNIGFGFQSTVARIGAITGPQLVFLDTKVAGMMYWICGAASVISIFFLLPIPETRGVNLTDKISRKSKVHHVNNQDMGTREPNTVEIFHREAEPSAILTKL